jgi:predicted lysophospholipase L1 biosynthesis ABC-type transport system permease subunit
MQPLDVSDLERVSRVPYLLGGLLGTIALVSVAVTLAAAARRRRRDLAVLRSLGLARPQVHALQAGQATAFLLLALTVGVPVGVVLGRVSWTVAADGLGSEAAPVVPLLGLAASVAILLVVVNLYAQGLALAIARRRPGADLRTE